MLGEGERRRCVRELVRTLSLSLAIGFQCWVGGVFGHCSPMPGELRSHRTTRTSISPWIGKGTGRRSSWGHFRAPRCRSTRSKRLRSGATELPCSERHSAPSCHSERSEEPLLAAGPDWPDGIRRSRRASHSPLSFRAERSVAEESLLAPGAGQERYLDKLGMTGYSVAYAIARPMRSRPASRGSGGSWARRCRAGWRGHSRGCSRLRA